MSRFEHCCALHGEPQPCSLCAKSLVPEKKASQLTVTHIGVDRVPALTDAWWQTGGWRQAQFERWQQSITDAMARRKSISDMKERDPLLRMMNPACAGSHDRTAHDIMACAECLAYTEAHWQDRIEIGSSEKRPVGRTLENE